MFLQHLLQGKKTLRIFQSFCKRRCPFSTLSFLSLICLKSFYFIKKPHSLQHKSFLLLMEVMTLSTHCSAEGPMSPIIFRFKKVKSLFKNIYKRHSGGKLYTVCVCCGGILLILSVAAAPLTPVPQQCPSFTLRCNQIASICPFFSASLSLLAARGVQARSVF